MGVEQIAEGLPQVQKPLLEYTEEGGLGMTVYYKLTDEKGRTYGKTQWGPGVTHTAIGEGADLCSDGWIHLYDSPLLAVLHTPIHANYTQPRLWECSIEGEILREGQMKLGAKSVTTLRETPVPKVTLTQRIAYGILCSLEVCKTPAYIRWAQAWLDNTNRADARAAWAAWTARADARAVAVAGDLDLSSIAQKAMKY